MTIFMLPKDKEKCLKFLDEIQKEKEMHLPKEQAMEPGKEGTTLNPIIYYLRDNENRPLVTISISRRFRAEDDYGVKILYTRGISVCSPRDLPNKRKGRRIAIGRMQLANFHGTTRLPIHRIEVKDVSFEICVDLFDFGHKSAYDVEPTRIEKKLFVDAERRLSNYVRKYQN
jgi:hypothetical protein